MATETFDKDSIQQGTEALGRRSELNARSADDATAGDTAQSAESDEIVHDLSDNPEAQGGESGSQGNRLGRENQGINTTVEGGERSA